MFHTQINGTIIVFSEKLTFKTLIDFRGTVPLRPYKQNMLRKPLCTDDITGIAFSLGKDILEKDNSRGYNKMAMLFMDILLLSRLS